MDSLHIVIVDCGHICDHISASVHLGPISGSQFTASRSRLWRRSTISEQRERRRLGTEVAMLWLSDTLVADNQRTVSDRLRGSGDGILPVLGLVLHWDGPSFEQKHGRIHGISAGPLLHNHPSAQYSDRNETERSVHDLHRLFANIDRQCSDLILRQHKRKLPLVGQRSDGRRIRLNISLFLSVHRKSSQHI